MSEFQNVHRFGFNMDNPEIVCPYCGYKYTDSNELSADEDEIITPIIASKTKKKRF